MDFKFDGDGNFISLSHPKYLYKFTSINENLYSMISENYLWFSDINDFNDPFECSNIVDSNVSEEEIKEYLKSSFNHLIKKYDLKELQENLESKLDLMMKEFSENRQKYIENLMTTLLNSLLKNKGICCLSEEKNSVLMWAHYANNFKGVCLVYDFCELVFSAPFAPLKVQYYKEIPKYNYIKHRLEANRNSDPYLDAKMNTELDKILFGAKTIDWSYEKEYRLLSFKQGKNLIKANSLKGIILGNRISEIQEVEFRKIVLKKQPDIIFTNITLDSSAKKVKCDDFDNEKITRNDVVITNLNRTINSNKIK